MTGPSSLGGNPQTAITENFSEIAALRRSVEEETGLIGASLDRAEARGDDTACLRLLLRELRWRSEYTVNAEAIRATMAKVRALAALPSPPASVVPDEDGSYGPWTDVWFLKLDASIDHLLAAEFDDRGRPPRFLDRINEPRRLADYLNSLLVSHPTKDGIDRRKELNLVTADLVRLILWRRPRNYPWDPRLEGVIHRFIGDWQDPATGFFGAGYDIDGRLVHTVDLSLTFHMARYLEGRIGYWPQLIETLLKIRHGRYPNGWLDEVGMTSHNAYDVAVLFQFGWPYMSAHQRRQGAAELARLLEWCSSTAIAADGEILVRAIGESLPESYYFTIAFLDTVGFFDRAKRFWTDRDFPHASALRNVLANHLLILPQGDPMVRMARERLSPSAAVSNPHGQKDQGCG
jgi:hypothetical protein